MSLVTGWRMITISLVLLLAAHSLRATPRVWKYPGVFSTAIWRRVTDGIYREKYLMSNKNICYCRM